MPAVVKKLRPAKPGEMIISKPTMCLHCHLIVELVLSASGEIWDCPRCSYRYPMKWWKIKPAGRRKRALDHLSDEEQSAAAEESD